jgi:hypothetical protein
MAAERKRLCDIILLNSQRERLGHLWHTTKAANELKPLPRGDYRCRVLDGNLFNTRSGTVGYKLALEVIEGEHAGRRLWHDIWLTEPAIGLAKRDLGKLGITSLEQLEQPLPEGIIVNAKVALLKGDDGAEFNRIARFDVVGHEPPEPEPFAPSPSGEPVQPGLRDQQGFNWETGEQEAPPPSGRGRGAYSQP